MLLATADAAGDPRFLQPSFDFGEDFWIISLRLPRAALTTSLMTR